MYDDELLQLFLPKVSDFGLVHWEDGMCKATFMERLTARGNINYIPPEVFTECSDSPGTAFDVYRWPARGCLQCPQSESLHFILFDSVHNPKFTQHNLLLFCILDVSDVFQPKRHWTFCSHLTHSLLPLFFSQYFIGCLKEEQGTFSVPFVWKSISHKVSWMHIM